MKNLYFSTLRIEQNTSIFLLTRSLPWKWFFKKKHVLIFFSRGNDFKFNPGCVIFLLQFREWTIEKAQIASLLFRPNDRILKSELLKLFLQNSRNYCCKLRTLNTLEYKIRQKSKNELWQLNFTCQDFLGNFF